MRPIRPVLLLSSAVLLLLVGCGGNEYTATAPGGADGTAGSVAIRDARFTANPPRTGDEAYAAGADAPLTFTAANGGDTTDRLVAVRSPVAIGSEIRGDGQIPAGSVLVSGSPDPVAGPSNVVSEVRITDLREPLRAGLTYPVTFTFERAGPITLQLPVDNPDALPPRADRPATGR